MLEPDSRAVLLDQLRPPPGFRLEAAVATTFTLSLQTALVPPLAFAAFTVRDKADPIAVLEAVRSCTSRVDLYCQAGQIAVPRAHSDLMAFLEPMVHPVQAPRPGYLFHPKLWFLHYRDHDRNHDTEGSLLMLEQETSLNLTSEISRHAAWRFLKCGVRSAEAFGDVVDQVRAQVAHLDRGLISAFLDGLREAEGETTLLTRVDEELGKAERGVESLTTWQTVGELRAVLARVSVSLLTPDLVILDEFQRFRELLAKDSEAGELAHHLFDHATHAAGRTKVLLLSATPYKPFTYAEETAAGDDHHRDFMGVVGFLGDGDASDPADASTPR